MRNAFFTIMHIDFKIKAIFFFFAKQVARLFNIIPIMKTPLK